MGKVQGIVLLLLVSALLGVVTFGAYETKVTKWDYVVVSVKDAEFHESMKTAGDNGWELVFARRAMRKKESKELLAEYEKTGKMDESEPLYEMIFKRPKSYWDAVGETQTTSQSVGDTSK